jgi:hypothetical protein
MELKQHVLVYTPKGSLSQAFLFYYYYYYYYYYKFQVLTAASMKMTFWEAVLSPCNLVEVYRRFRDDYGVRHQGYDSS